ncbi:MAG: hypothetical protein V4556_06975 [Bacteroidota bacterium]
MKLVASFTIAFLCIFSASAQTQAYKNFLKIIKNQKQVLVKEKNLYLAKGETGYAIWPASYLEDYTVYCWGEDGDVTDADVYVYDSTGSVIVKDTKNEILGIVHFTVEDFENIKVVGKNSGSTNPTYKALFHIMLCIKEEE